MRATVDRQLLASALSRLSGVVERRQTIPILGHVALTADNGSLRLRTTDMDMEASDALLAAVDAPGATTVSVERLHAVAREGAGDEVSLSLDGRRVQVRCGGSRFSLPTELVEDFPSFDAVGLGEAWTMSAADLADMLASVAFCVADAASLSSMSCVYLAITETELHVVGCYQSGMAIQRAMPPQGAEGSALLPLKLAQHLAKWLAGRREPVEISIAQGRLIRFTLGDASLISKVFDGAYVNYPAVLRERHDEACIAPRDGLMRAIRRASIVASANSDSLRFSASEGQIKVSTRNPVDGECEDDVRAEYAGPGFGFLLPASKTASALSAIRSDDVAIYWGGDTSPIVFRAPDETGVVINLMPARA